MQLEKLVVEKDWRNGGLKGKIAFAESGIGEIELILDNAAIREIILSCADSLERVSREAAEKFRGAILGATKEAKEIQG